MKYFIINNGELYHHGVKGMKWGRRKGKTHNGSKAVKNKPEDETQLMARRKKAIVKGAAVVGTILAIYGMYAYSRYRKEKTAEYVKAMQLASEPLSSFRS